MTELLCDLCGKVMTGVQSVSKQQVLKDGRTMTVDVVARFTKQGQAHVGAPVTPLNVAGDVCAACKVAAVGAAPADNHVVAELSAAQEKIAELEAKLNQPPQPAPVSGGDSHEATPS